MFLFLEVLSEVWTINPGRIHWSVYGLCYPGSTYWDPLTDIFQVKLPFDFMILLLCITTTLTGVFLTTLTEVFPCFLLSCKANGRVKPAKTGHGPHSSYFFCCSIYFFVLFCIFFVLFYVLFVLCCSLYCLCVYVYCTTATGFLPNCG
jgi:hypothetical protein